MYIIGMVGALGGGAFCGEEWLGLLASVLASHSSFRAFVLHVHDCVISRGLFVSCIMFSFIQMGCVFWGIATAGTVRVWMRRTTSTRACSRRARTGSPTSSAARSR